MNRINLNWKDKYILSLKEELSTNEICSLLDIPKCRAYKIRDKAISHCLHNDIDLFGNKVPTEAVLLVIGKDIEYFYNKMLLENRALGYSL